MIVLVVYTKYRARRLSGMIRRSRVCATTRFFAGVAIAPCSE